MRLPRGGGRGLGAVPRDELTAKMRDISSTLVTRALINDHFTTSGQVLQVEQQASLVSDLGRLSPNSGNRVEIEKLGDIGTVTENDMLYMLSRSLSGITMYTGRCWAP